MYDRFVCDVQYGGLYGELYDGFVRPWKWTFALRTKNIRFFGESPPTQVVHQQQALTEAAAQKLLIRSGLQ
jgi:hypothetical protein